MIPAFFVGETSRERGARHIEIETSDDQMIRRQAVIRMIGFFVRREIAWSMELGAWSWGLLSGVVSRRFYYKMRQSRYLGSFPLEEGGAERRMMGRRRRNKKMSPKATPELLTAHCSLLTFTSDAKTVIRYPYSVYRASHSMNRESSHARSTVHGPRFTVDGCLAPESKAEQNPFHLLIPLRVVRG